MILRRRREQTQSSGTGSQQNQASGDLAVTNVQIAQLALVDQKNIALETFTAAGRETGNARMGEFNDRFLSQLSDEQLRAFSDPAFQVLARQAQIAAACSGEDSDYDLLIQLLSERADDDRRAARSGISSAIQVIDKIDARALHALTISINFLMRSMGLPTIAANLDNIDDVLTRTWIDDLPTGPRWLEHLDTLGLVRVSYGNLLSNLTTAQVFTDRLKGYIGPSVSPADAEAFNDELTENGLDNFVFSPHDFDPGAVRLGYPRELHLDWALQQHGCSADQIVLIKRLAAERMKFGEIDPDYQTQMLAEADRRPGLRRFKEWRDAIELPFVFTELGKLVGFANLQRLIPETGVPRFDFDI